MSIPGFVLLEGAVVGLNYGLLAMGLVLVYKTNRVLNFAQGQLGVVAAVFLVKCDEDFGFNYWFSLVLAIALAAAMGALSELVLRRLFKRPRVLVMVATIGLSQVLFVFTALPFILPKHLSNPFPVPIHLSFTVDGFVFDPGAVLTLIVAPVVAIAFAAFIRFSPWGLAMRAMSENADSARLSGVWVRRASTMAWTLAAILSAFTAILASPGQTSVLTQPLSPDLLLFALTAALIGAMVNLTVSFVAGIAVGIIYEILELEHLVDRVSPDDHVRPPARRAARPRGRAAQGGPHRRAVDVALRIDGGAPGADSRSAAGGDRRRGGHRRGRRTSALRDLDRQLVPAEPDLHLRGDRPVPHRAHRLGRASLTRAVRSRGGGGRDGRPPQVLHAPRRAHALRRRGDSGDRHHRRAARPALPRPLPGRLHPRLRSVDSGVGAGHAVLDGAAGGQELCTGLPNPASTLISRPDLFGISLGSERAFAWFSLGVLVLTVLMVRMWRDRGVARRLVSVRDNEVAAAAMGITVVRTKLLAFALSGFMAGYAGVCLAFASERFSTDTFDPTFSCSSSPWW